jgi:hypothetical protein
LRHKLSLGAVSPAQTPSAGFLNVRIIKISKIASFLICKMKSIKVINLF